jgi:succinate dehydrogenase / fumarate reductase, membrane anchor subunit
MASGSPLKRVRGLGAAHEGAHHWWRQRLTAGLNIALLGWLVLLLARMPAYDLGTVRMYLGSAWVAVPMALLVANLLTHVRLGLQVVIEDYQHDETRVVLMVLLNAFVVALGAVALFAILKLAFTAGVPVLPGAPR